MDAVAVKQREKFAAFLQGWRDGAGMKPKKASFEESNKDHISDAYVSGYNEGAAALGAATRKASDIYAVAFTLAR